MENFELLRILNSPLSSLLLSGFGISALVYFRLRLRRRMFTYTWFLIFILTSVKLFLQLATSLYAVESVGPIENDLHIAITHLHPRLTFKIDFSILVFFATVIIISSLRYARKRYEIHARLYMTFSTWVGLLFQISHSALHYALIGVIMFGLTRLIFHPAGVEAMANYRDLSCIWPFDRSVKHYHAVCFLLSELLLVTVLPMAITIVEGLACEMAVWLNTQLDALADDDDD